MKKFIYHTYQNVLMFVLIVLTTSILYLISFDFYKDQRIHKRDQYLESLPNTHDINWYHQAIVDLKKVKTSYSSYLGWKQNELLSPTIEIDSNGLRRTVNSDFSGKNIFFTGGSLMFGTLINDENTIPSLVSKYGESLYYCSNLGLSGYNSFQSHMTLKLNLLNGNIPDIVVTIDGGNDIYFKEKYKLSSDLIVNKRLNQNSLNVYGYIKSIFIPLIDFSSRFSEKIKNIKTGKLKGHEDNSFFDDKYYNNKATELLDSWLLSKKMSDDYNFDFYAILQPNIFEGDPFISYIDLEKTYYDFDYLNGIYPRIYKEIRLLLKTTRYKELNDYVYDFTDIFNISEPVYIDHLHCTPNGNELIAKRIIDILKA
tara:strand:- start:2634 stop:3740 length:1107 start_codon:yes stop_codon:yes gene_type:complete